MSRPCKELVKSLLLKEESQPQPPPPPHPGCPFHPLDELRRYFSITGFTWKFVVCTHLHLPGLKDRHK